MICPGRRRQVECLGLRSRIEFDKEECTKVDGSSARDGLERNHLAFSD